MDTVLLQYGEAVPGGMSQKRFESKKGKLHLPTICKYLKLANVELNGAVPLVDPEGFTYSTFPTNAIVHVSACDPLPGAAAGPGPGSVGSAGAGDGKIVSEFEQLCGSRLTDRERIELLFMDGVLRAVGSKEVTEIMAHGILQRIRSALHTSTKQVILHVQDYLVDGCIGRGQAMLYSAFKGAAVVCAKVFTGPGAATSMDSEKAVSDAVHGAVHCPSLIKVLDAFQVKPHGNEQQTKDQVRCVVILPLLAKSAHDLRSCRGYAGGSVSDEAAAYIAAGALAALGALAMTQHAHNDLKPHNLMLAADEKRVVLVDLGSCTKAGADPMQVTAAYSLDALNEKAGLRRDLVCLATTLAELGDFFGSDVPKSGRCTVQALLDNLRSAAKSGNKLSLACGLALEVLEHAQLPTVGSVDALRSLFDRVVSRVEGLCDAAAAERTASWWPTAIHT